MLRLSTWLTPPPIEFDDGDTVHRLQLQIRQLTLAERPAVQEAFDRWMHPPSQAMVARRSDRDDEMATAENGVTFLLSDAEVKRRRLAEMSAEERDRYDAMVKAEAQERQDAVLEDIRRFVRVQPGQVEYQRNDGEVVPVETGKQLVEAFVHRGGFLAAIWGLFYGENFVGPTRKKVLPSRSSSTTSSPAPSQGRTGRRPETAAAPATREGSAGGADATAGTDAPSSGGPVH